MPRYCNKCKQTKSRSEFFTGDISCKNCKEQPDVHVRLDAIEKEMANIMSIVEKLEENSTTQLQKIVEMLSRENYCPRSVDEMVEHTKNTNTIIQSVDNNANTIMESIADVRKTVDDVKLEAIAIRETAANLDNTIETIVHSELVDEYLGRLRCGIL